MHGTRRHCLHCYGFAFCAVFLCSKLGCCNETCTDLKIGNDTRSIFSEVSDQGSRINASQLEHFLKRFNCCDQNHHTHGENSVGKEAETHHEHDHVHDHKNHVHEHDHNHQDHETSTKNICLTTPIVMERFGRENMLDLCQFANFMPHIVYNLYRGKCCSNHSVAVDPKKAEVVEGSWQGPFACVIAVIFLSSTGLIVIVLIPFMSSRYYNVITQFLIALSVGSLIGDAFLHLIPHALQDGHDHSSSNHTQAIGKSFVAIMGIYAFFLSERLTIWCQNNTTLKQIKREQSDNAHRGSDNGSQTAPPVVTTAIKSKDPQFFSHSSKLSTTQDEEFSTTAAELPMITPREPSFCNALQDPPMDNLRCADYINAAHGRSTSHVSSTLDISNHDSAYFGIATPHNNPANATVNGFQNPSTDHKSDTPQFLLVSNGDPLGQHTKTTTVSNLPAVTVVFSEKENEEPVHPFRNKPHSHHHGHSHDLSSIRTIAYTLLAGDGVHRFCDGIAVGAAFSFGIKGGISTTIAVLCHELPHEIGDFLVLLRAGMSFKTAFCYNFLVGLLCTVGALIGYMLGGIKPLDCWLFILTSGIFIYIALVNMVPELTSKHMKGDPRFHRAGILFIFQNVGILLGYAIMLLIGLYEGGLF